MAVSDIAASDIVETVPSALLILDRNLNISSANRAFYQTFRTSPDETEGCLIYDLGNRQWDIPALRTLLESVIPHRASVEGFEVEHDFPTIGRRTMLVNARKIFRPGEHDGFILLAIEDVSEERAARKESNRTIQDHATFASPHQLSTGVFDVWVNGVRALNHGSATGAASGRVVHGRAWLGAAHGGCRASARDWSWTP